METPITKSAALRTEFCDYLVVGAGATGMAFCDTLLRHTGRFTTAATTAVEDAPTAAVSPKVKVILIDRRASPGGHWNDSYAFVQLHQPSHLYGVETEPLEPTQQQQGVHEEAPQQQQQPPAAVATAAVVPPHRATREEILQYYDQLRRKLEATYDFTFWGHTTLDLAQIHAVDHGRPGAQAVAVAAAGASTTEGNSQYILEQSPNCTRILITVRKKLVDARYLEPDIPHFVPPKFAFDPESIYCVPVNDMMVSNADQQLQLQQHRQSADGTNPKKYYVIIGGGKTGMDAILYLLLQKQQPVDQIWWIAPHDAWLTAREHMGSCMEFLHACTQRARAEIHHNNNNNCNNNNHLSQVLQSTNLVQNTFAQWEREGRVYRLQHTGGGAAAVNEDNWPTKFNDATISRDEKILLETIPHVLRGRGRVQAIVSDTGALQMEDGTVVPLPWAVDNPDRVKHQTTYVHCSAGAFNYTQQQQQRSSNTPPPLVFDRHVITIQDVYGTPGFCFVGSVIGKLESLGDRLTDTAKNAMCQCPTPPRPEPLPRLGPQGGGDVHGISPTHGSVQRLSNLRQWLRVPELRDWLVGHRLFNLGHLDNAEDMAALVDATWEVLHEGGLV